MPITPVVLFSVNTDSFHRQAILLKFEFNPSFYLCIKTGAGGKSAKLWWSRKSLELASQQSWYMKLNDGYTNIPVNAAFVCLYFQKCIFVFPVLYWGFFIFLKSLMYRTWHPLRFPVLSDINEKPNCVKMTIPPGFC